MRFDGDFFIPVADTYNVSRADLFFGLRRAVRFYNEVVVPGIAGVHFIRQLSWAAGALHLRNSGAEKLPYSAIKIANGIEALGCKLAWGHDREKYHFRGVRAFARNEDELSFKVLSTQSGYVQIPYRMATVRALPEFSGLGLVREGTMRFNQMELTAKGEEFAEIFLGGSKVGRGGGSVGSFLGEWLRGKRAVGENASHCVLYKALGPDVPSSQEQKTVIECLKTVVTLPSDLHEDPDRRIRLVEYFAGQQNEPFLDWAKRTNNAYAVQLLAAQAFDEFRKGIQTFYAACTGELDTLPADMSLQELSGKQNVEKSFNELVTKSKAYIDAAKEVCEHQDSIRQAEAFVKDKIMECSKQLIAMDDRILTLVDNKVTRGPLYRNMLGTEEDMDEAGDLSELPQDTDLPHSRLTQLRWLLRDCGVITEK